MSDEYSDRPHWDEGHKEYCRYCGVYFYSKTYQHGADCPVTLRERIEVLEELVRGLIGPPPPEQRYG